MRGRTVFRGRRDSDAEEERVSFDSTSGSGSLPTNAERWSRYVFLPLFKVLIFETVLPQRQAPGFKQEEAIPYRPVPLFVHHQR